ncbi:MAG: Uncharacterized protein G01um101429_144 [Parcubacteria group bacterium Gr01-1014_29]|nr:MAG: Uncharacterized protein G01um101429_144 [Parcubacteria group bacterium Gr01-1014_29]
MEQEILTDPQKAAISFIAHEQRLSSYYLSGGTALAAYYLYHRLSDDLDFFTPEAPDIVFLHEFGERLKQYLKAHTVHFQRLYDRNMFEFLGEFGALKIEFTKYPFPQLEAPTIINEVHIDSFSDVSANKARRIAGLPRMIQPVSIEELKAFFSDRARELKGSILL